LVSRKTQSLAGVVLGYLQMLPDPKMIALVELPLQEIEVRLGECQLAGRATGGAAAARSLQTLLQPADLTPRRGLPGTPRASGARTRKHQDGGRQQRLSENRQTVLYSLISVGFPRY
jgi:hypothetical protein